MSTLFDIRGGRSAPATDAVHIRPRARDVDVPSTDDGRNIDPRIGLLAGEGAQIAVGVPGRAAEIELPPLEHVAPPDASRTYYGLPVLKRPPWKIWIPTYLFVGGLSGSAAALGAAAQIAGGKHVARLVLPARWITTAGLAASALLLIADLGRPARFLNMLRVFRPTSPMNMGTWIVTLTGTSAGASAILPLLGARRLANAAGIVAGASGLGLVTYTAILLASTATPAWQYGVRTLPLLFTASAAASGGSTLGLILRRPGPARSAAELFATVGKIAELALEAAYDRELASAGPRVVRHFRSGRAGVLANVSRALTVASLALSFVRRRSRAVRVASDILGLAGALALRFAVMDAGRTSALDPRATFEPQRRARAARLERDVQARDERSPREAHGMPVPAC